MATIETKYVDVGYFQGVFGFPDQYGFNSAISIGTLSDTANGSSNEDVSGIYSSTDCQAVVWYSTNALEFRVEGVKSNSGWDSITVGSTTLNRSSATFTTSTAGSGTSSWTWYSQSNPFGTQTGADVLVTWDDGQTSSVATPTGFTATDATGSGQTYPNGTGTTINLSANALSGHTLQFRQGTGSFSSTSSYSHTYGAQLTYEARYVRTSDSAVSATAASITRRVADVNITISPVTSITAGNTTNELKIADIGSATANTQYRARATGNINGSSVTNLFINAPVATGANPDINAANPGELPAAGESATYSIMARIRSQDNGDGNYRQLPPNITNRSWTLARATAGPTAPVISSVSATNTAGTTVTTTVNLSSNGSGGTLEYAQSTTNSIPSTGWQTSNQFTHPRPTPAQGSAITRYYWASQNRNTSGFSSGFSRSVGYFTGDPSATVASITPSSPLAYAYTGSVDVVITGGSAGTRYRVLNTTTNAGMGNTGDGNGTVTITNNSTNLPTAGNTSSYKLQYKVIASNGGNDIFSDVSPAATFNITRTAADTTPNTFSFSDLTSQATNTEVETSVQITGIEVSVTASRTGGTGTFAVGTSSTPGTYSTSSKTITNGQYIWVKDTTSTSNGVGKSTTISVGGISDTWNYSTVSSGDVTISISYDKESSSFLPDPGFTPFVSGQNGLSNGQAYEITGGQDVIFSHVSDPGANSLTISSLSQFTSNSSFTITQGQSATRTWANNNLGNDVDAILVTANDSSNGNPTVLLYVKEPPVAPDTSVSPVTPTNRSFNDTSTFNVTVNNVTSGETYKITENNFTTSLGSATASGTSVTIPMTIGNQQGNPYGQLAVGATKTYEIHASRPANLGGTGSFVQTNDTFTVTRSVEPVTTPANISFSDPGTNDDNVNITVEGVGGSGGTLQVSNDNSNWDADGTAYAAIRNTQATYYARRLGSQGASVSGTRTVNYTPPFRGADSNISISGSAVGATVSPGATGNLTLTISNGGSLDEYRVVTTDTNTPLSSGASAGSRTSNGNITISSGEQPDAQGTSAGYKVQVRRPTATGGNNTFADTGDTFTITRQTIGAPTDISFGADPGTASATVSITVTAQNAANGTVELSETSNFSSTQGNGTTFTFTRGTAKTIYARTVDGSVVSSTYSEAHTVGYLTPDTAIAGTNSTITFNATSATTTVSGVARGTDTVAVRVNNGSTNLATRTGNGAVSFTGSLPSVGNATTYEFFTRRAVSTGGDGSTFYATNDTFTVTRSVEPVSAPTDISFGTSNSASATVSIACTASGGSGGDLEVSEDNINWSSNGSSFTFTRGTAKTIYARRAGQGSTSSSYSEAHTVGYLTPDTAIAGTNSTITFNATSATTTVSGVARGTDTVAVRVNNGSTNLATRTGNGAVSFTGSLPSVGNATTYEFFTRRAVSTGGDGSTFYATNDTFTVTRSVEPVSAPTDISFGADPGTADELVLISCTASGGSGGTLQVSQDNTNWYNSPHNFTFTRGTAKTIYARRAGQGSTSSSYSEAHTVGYLTPDTAIAGTNSTITFNATSATTTVSGVARGTDTVAVRVNNGSTNLATRTGNGAVSFTGSLPSVGNATTYEFFTKRAVSTGGNGSTFYATNDTFTVTRSVEPVSAPTDISFGTSSSASATVSIACTASGGSGGDLEVSQDNVNWSSNGSSFTFTRGTAKTIYARRVGQGSTSSSYSEAHTVGYLASDFKVDLSPTSVTLAHNANSDVTITLTNGSPGNEYKLMYGNANLDTLSLTGSSTSGTLTIGTGVHPAVNASRTYNLYVRRTTVSGGNNTYVLTDDTVTITRNSESVSAPDDIDFGADPGTFSSTVSISATAEGGTGGTLKVSDDGNNWDNNGTSYTFTRGTAKNIYARREAVGANSANYIESHTVNKLATDTSITVSPTSATVAPNANTTVTINISNATQQHTYHVYKQTGTNTYQGININTGTLSGSTGSVTIPNSQLPTAGNSITYRFYGILPTASGGLGLQQSTNGTFTISRTAEDTTPDAFTFTDVSGVARSATQTSNTVTIAGLSAGTSVVASIIGGTYSKNSGPYTSSTGIASNGDTFSVRHTSSSGFLTNTDTQLTIGGISDTFRSTTLAQDTTPDNYTFNNTTNAGVSTLTVSNVETITGITGSVSVSVSGQGTPKISINGGTFVSSGTIQNNQTLQVRLTSSASNSTSHTATVTLGTGTYAQETFVVTTVAASGGTGGGVGAGSSDYGVEIYDIDGTTKVLSPSTRYAVRVTDVTTHSFTASGTTNDSVLLTTDMTDLTTSNSDVLFLPGSLVLTVSRESNGFRVTNISSGTLTRTMFGIRF